MPDGLSKVDQLAFLQPAQAGCSRRSRAGPTPTCSPWSSASSAPRSLEMGRDHALGDQVALEALVRLTDEELKHQELFRRLDAMAAVGMPDGYGFLPQPNEVAAAVLSKSTWAVLALTLDIELFTQAHYRSSIEPDDSSRSCARTCSCSTGRRSRSTRSSTSSSGGARTRALAGRARPGRRRSDRAGRRGRRHVPGAGREPMRTSSSRAAPPVRRRRGAAIAEACSRPIAGSTSSPARRSRASSRC